MGRDMDMDGETAHEPRNPPAAAPAARPALVHRCRRQSRRAPSFGSRLCSRSSCRRVLRPYQKQPRHAASSSAPITTKLFTVSACMAPTSLGGRGGIGGIVGVSDGGDGHGGTGVGE